MNTSNLTERIIGTAIEVHQELGPGFLESIYEEALCVALADAGLKFKRQLRVPVRFRGREIGEHRLDLLVEDTVVVELKAIAALGDVHFATVRSYLKATELAVGLLLNFTSTTLTVKRVGREWFSRRNS